MADDAEILRLGIDPQPAAAGAREYKRATQEVEKAAQGAADANEMLAVATDRASASAAAADQHMRRTRLTVDERIAAGRRLLEVTEAIDRATAEATRQEQQFQQVMANLRIGVALGAVTPEQAAEEGRAAAMAYNEAVARVLQDNSMQMNRTLAGRAAFMDLTTGLKDVEVASTKSSMGMAKLNNATASLARQMIGVHPVFSQLADTVGTFAIGTAYMTAVFAGLAGLAYWYREATEETRAAKEEAEKYREVLDSIDRMREPGKEIADALENQKKLLADLDRQRKAARGAADNSFFGEGAEQQRQIYLKQADDLDRQYEELARVVETGEEELAEIRVTANRDSLRNSQEYWDGVRNQRDQASGEATRATEREQRELEQRVAQRQRELDAVHAAVEAAREYARAAQEVVDTYAREAYEAEAALAVKKAGKDAEDALTVALAMQAAVRENLGKVSDEQLVRIAEDARRTAQAAIDTQAFSDAQEELTRRTREQTEAQEKQNQALKDYAASAALGVATGMLASGGDTGKAIGGVVGGAVAGYQAAGPWGAVIGGAASAVTSLFNMGKKAREAAEQFAKAQENFQRSLDDAIAMFDAEDGTRVEQELEKIRQATNKWLDDLGKTWTGAKKIKPIDADLPVEEWLDHMRVMAQKLGEQIAMTEMAGKETDKLVASHEALIDIYELTEKQLARQAELHREAQDAFDNELTIRWMVAQGREDEAESMRLFLRHAEEMAEALRNAWDPAVMAHLKNVQAAEAAALAASQLARQEEELTEARERAVSVAEDIMVRALEAMGRSAEAARASLLFRQRREMADSPEDQRGALGLLHQLELLQLELNQRIAEIEEHAREQVALLESQIDQADEQLRLTEEQISVHEQALMEMQRVVEALSEFRDSLLLGPLTVLDPADQLAEAERQFQEAYEKAQAGDADAAASLPALAQAFLEASREYFASGSGYQADFQQVLDALDTVGEEFEQRASTEEEILAELRKQTTKLERQIDEMRKQQAAINQAAADEVRALQAEFDSRTNNMYAQLAEMIKAVVQLGNIATYTNLEQQLRGQIRMKDGVIEALQDAYQDVNEYWTDLMNEKDAAFTRELNRLIGIINDLMQGGARLQEQGIRIGAAGSLQVVTELQGLREEVAWLRSDVRHGRQEAAVQR